ncbi:MAG: YeeE/YedE family protein [Polyangiaceae bacterium]
MKSTLSTFVAGALFGTGLVLSGMTDPNRVKGFLDFAGHWDMSLLWVMGGAISVYAPVFWLRRRKDPSLLASISPPGPPKRVDGSLLLGAGLFGVGWGLAGVCPGPAVAASSTGSSMTIIAVSIVLGIALHEVVAKAWARTKNGRDIESAGPTPNVTCLD